MFQKLRNAVPLEQLEDANKKYEIERTKNNELCQKNIRLISHIETYKRKDRLYKSAEIKNEMFKGEIMNLEEEYEIIAARLELKDKIFKWE